MFFRGWLVGWCVGGWLLVVVVVCVCVRGMVLFQGCDSGEYISMGEYDGTRGLLCWFVCFR